jgi:predicted acyltransferase
VTAASLISHFASRDLARRDYAVDVVRGLAIVGMVLVNHPPPTTTIYAPLKHAVWHGWTFADTIFPAFLFIVGVSIVLSLRADTAASRRDAATHLKILRRTLLILVANFVLENFPYYDVRNLRFTGTLAHIAWCYLIVSLIYLHCGERTRTIILALALVVPVALFILLDAPDAAGGVMTPEGNASRYIDRVLISRETMQEGDPFSILILVSSSATTLVGVAAGRWLQSDRTREAKVAAMFAVGAAALVLGSAWGEMLPINKQLWTPSYVVLTSGISLQLFAAIYWLTDVAGLRSWAKPLQVAGVNAMVFYLFAQFLQRFLYYGRVRSETGERVPLGRLAYERLIAPHAPGEAGALFFAVLFLLVCLIPIVLLYRKRVFVRL